MKQWYRTTCLGFIVSINLFFVSGCLNSKGDFFEPNSSTPPRCVSE